MLFAVLKYKPNYALNCDFLILVRCIMLTCINIKQRVMVLFSDFMEYVEMHHIA